MTHEAGIEAAVNSYFGGAGRLHRESLEVAIQAYLSASGMVLVPREATDDMINEAAYARPEIRTADLPIVYEVMINSTPDPFKSKPGE